MTTDIAADRIVDCLTESGITHFFGLPGGATMEIYKALHGRDDIRVIVPRDEQAASCMADMYGKLTGRPGVFAGQGGFVGSTGMFGVIEAFLASSPMLVLSELSDADSFAPHGPIQSGSGHYGGFDLPSIFARNTKYLSVAHTPREAVLGTQIALKHAVAGRPGPAASLFRSNVLRESVAERDLPVIHETQRLLPDTSTLPPARALDAAAERLVGAERPVIVAGNGVRIARAFDTLAALAECLGAPVVTSTLGKSAIAETHDLAAGPIGYTGTPLANETLGHADVVLVLGCRLKPQETCFENPSMLDANRQTIIQIDIDPRNVSWTFPAEIALVGDARLSGDALLERLRAGVPAEKAASRRRDFAARRRAARLFDHPKSASPQMPILPQALVGAVQRATPADAIVCSDAGNNRHWMNHFFQCRRAGSYFGTGGLGGVSWSLPATLTAALLHPERPAIGVCSDGGFAMQMHVLLTARQYDLAPVYVVMNNSRLGMTAEGMGNRAIGNDFPDTDYAAIARACGVHGERITRPEEIGDALRSCLDRRQASVVDVVIDPDESMRGEIYSPLALATAGGRLPD